MELVGGKVDVIEGTIYTVSMYSKFVDKVPNCNDNNFGLKNILHEFFIKILWKELLLTNGDTWNGRSLLKDQ